MSPIPAPGDRPGAGEESDEALLRAHVAGDAEAFGMLFARHRDRLWAVALRTTGDREDAADALQEAMVSAYRRAGSFRGDARVTTWLHRVVVNACLDRIRARQVRAAAPLPDDVASDARATLGPVGVTAPVDPADAAVAADRRRRVIDALATLPVEQRAALVLVDLEGLSVAEAAAVLDCPTGTVKSRCARGRSRLALLLEVLREPPAPAREPAHGNQPAPPAVPATDPARGPPAAGA